MALLFGVVGGSRDRDVLRGTTSDGLPVRLELEGKDRLRAVDVSWQGPCPDEIYEGGVKRTRRAVSVRVGDDGSFAWSGRHRVELDGVDDDLRVPVRLSGRVRPDGTVAATWFTGDAAGPEDYDESCVTTMTRLRARRQPAVPRELGSGVRATPLEDDGSAVAVAGGYVWVLGDEATDEENMSRPPITRVDATSGRVRARFSVRGGTLASDGVSAWLAAYEHTATAPYRSRVTLSRLDPDADRALPVPDREPYPKLNPDVNGVAMTRGAVWMMQDARLLKIDTRTGRTVRTVLPPKLSRRCAGEDQFVDLVASGTLLWARASGLYDCPNGEPSELVRIDAETGRLTRLPHAQLGAYALTAARSALWGVVDEPGRQTIRRIDPPSGHRTATLTTRLDRATIQLAIGTRTIWILGQYRGRAVLQRLDPGASKTTVVLRLRSRASTIAVGGDTAWVVDRDKRELLRATPAPK